MQKLVVPFLLFFLILFSINVKALIVDYNYITDDTWISKYNPTTNYGSNVELVVSGGNGNYTSYIKFNLSDYFSDKNISSLKANLSLWHRGYMINSNTVLTFNIYNTTLNWTEENVTYNAKPLLSTLITNLSVIENDINKWNNYSIDSAVLNAINSGNYIVSIAIQRNESISNDGVGYVSKEYTTTSLRPFLTIDYNVSDCFADCGDCGCNIGTNECYIPTIIGSYCDYNGFPNGAIKTVPNTSCTGTTYFVCPNGTQCTQITPEYNFSGSDIWSSQNNTDWCSGCFFINIWNIFKGGYSIVTTNCYDTSTNPARIKYECECNGIYCANMYTTNDNSTFVSTIPEWTAGCWNDAQQKYYNIINSTGQNTTVGDLIKIYVNNTTQVNNTRYMCDKLNTSTQCYDSNCQLVSCTINTPDSCSGTLSYTSALTCGLGGLLGVNDIQTSNMLSSILFTLIGSVALVGIMAYVGIDSSILGQSFMISSLMLIIMFTMIGWFPSWILIILMVLSGLLIAKTLKVF